MATHTDALTKAAEKAVKTLLSERAVENLDRHYELVSNGLSHDELASLDCPALFVEFDENGVVADWVIAGASEYLGNPGTAVAIILPGATAKDVRAAVDEAFSIALEGNPDYSDFASRHGITIGCKQLSTRKDVDGWPKGSSHWDCVMRRGKKSMKVIFSMGPALTGPPDVAEVLYSVAADAGTWEQEESAEGLADAFGMDEREARKLWKSLETQTGRLQRFLDDPALYEELLYETEENPLVNPVSPRMRSALYAGAGSLIGTILGGALAGGAGAWMGSVAGGAAGGYLGSDRDEQLGGAVGGALGGTLFPLGAAAGAYIGTYQENPTGAVEIIDTRQDQRKGGKVVSHTRGTAKDFHRTVRQQKGKMGIVVQYLVANEIVADNQGSGGSVRVFDEEAMASGTRYNPSRVRVRKGRR